MIESIQSTNVYASVNTTPAMQSNAKPAVDFKKADELLSTIALTEEVLAKTKAKKCELQEMLQRESGVISYPFTATQINCEPIVSYKADPDKSYTTLMKEMSEEATLRNRSARNDARLIMQLQEELRKEEEISAYLNSLKQQVQDTQPEASTSSPAARRESSPIETVAKIAGLVATLTLAPMGAMNSIIGGVVTYKLVKVVGKAMQDVDNYLCSTFKFANNSMKTPQYRFI